MCQLRQVGCKQKLHEMEERKKLVACILSGGDRYVLFHNNSIFTWPVGVDPLAAQLSETDTARQIPGNKNNLFHGDTILETGFLNTFWV